MKILAFLLGLTGGVMCIIGGMNTDLDPQIYAKLQGFISMFSSKNAPTITSFVKTAITMGGISIIAGAVVGLTLNRTIGGLLMLLGLLGGLTPAGAIVISAIQSGLLQKTSTEITHFIFRQGQAFIGVLFSFTGFILMKK